jgi:hypothetical protein
MPVRGFLIAVPEGARLTVEVLSSERTIEDGYRVYPVPQPVVEEGGTRILERFCLDAEAYLEDACYPREVASVGFYGYLREVQVAQVLVCPVQYNPARCELTIHSRIRLKLNISQGSFAPGEPVPARHHSKKAPFEGIYRDLILNYEPAQAQRAGGRPGQLHRHLRLPYLDNRSYKILVEADGVYEVTYRDLEDAGLPVTGIDPRTIKVFNLGREVAISVPGQEDGTFDEGDRIEFWGEANPSEYSATNVYWLTWNGAPGLRMAEVHSAPQDTLPTPEWFTDSLHVEQDSRYYSNVYQGEGKDHWFWEQLTAPCSRVYNLTLQGVAEASGTADLTINLRGRTAVSHQMAVSLNGLHLDNINWSGMVELERTWDFQQSTLIEGTNSLRIVCPGSALDQVFFNWFEVKYRRRFEAHEDYLRFSTPGPGPFQLDVGGFSDSTVEVFSIDGGYASRLVDLSISPDPGGYRVAFESIPGAEEYVALTPARKMEPVDLVPDDPSDLRSTANSADYIIIAHSDFLDALLPLKSLRESEGLAVELVEVTDIYDEFNYGLFDPGAIRSFLEHTYWEWHDPAPAYVLLVGDASYDYRGNIPGSNPNYVPTHLFVSQSDYLQTATDDWFGCVAGDDRLPDMLVGRFSAQTEAHARAMVDKTIAYETALSRGDWRERLVLVADDPDRGGDFEAYCDEFADDYILPAGFTVEKTYLTQCGTGCRPRLKSQLDDGCVLCTYMGHGSVTLWAAEQILEASDVQSLQNGGRPHVMVSFTCLNGFFHHATDTQCFAEAFTRAPDRGSVAWWCHSGLDYALCSGTIGNFLYRSMLTNGNYILGSAVRTAKIDYLATSPYFWDQAEMLILFGDPALEIGLPGRADLLVGSIAFDPPSPVAGTEAAITAQVYNAGREGAAGFSVRFTNGHPESSSVSLITDVVVSEVGPGEHTAVRAAWDSVPDPGTYSVFVEIDPDDAITESSEWNNMAGDTLRVRLANETEDSVPPGIVMLVDGDIVGHEFNDRDFTLPNPSVGAVLTDHETGIDVETVELILNNSSVSGFTLDKHKAGADTVRLTCQLDSLPDGAHDLKVVVSDCGREPNETVAEVTFVVESDLKIRRVGPRPNPAQGNTAIAFSLSRPADRVTFRIYSPSGQLISSVDAGPCGRNINTVNWDCRDRNGGDVAGGVYFYRIHAGRGSGRASCQGKIVVLR